MTKRTSPDHVCYKFDLPGFQMERLKHACQLLQISRGQLMRMIIDLFCDEIEANEKAGMYQRVEE